MYRRFRGAFLFIGLVLAAGPAWTAGFGFYEQGAKATAMGGAFAGLADDPSAIFYNPAGIAFQDHYALMAGTTATTFPRSEFRGDNPYPGSTATGKYHKTWFFPSNGYILAPLTPNIHFGIGLFSPFGLAVRWENPETFSGRFVAQNTAVKTFSIEPAIALRLTPTFSVAAGAEYRLSNAELEKNEGIINPFTQSFVDVAHVRLVSDNTHAWGWNAGFLWKPNTRFSAGGSYRAKMTMNYEGKVKFDQRFTGNPALDATVAASLPHKPLATTSLDFPAIANFGVAFQLPSQGMTVTADAVWTEWSTYKQLDIVFPGGEAPNIHRVTAWKNSWTYRFGAEKKIGVFAARVGFLYDESPQPDREVSPILPDAIRRGYSFGFGIDTEKFGIDFAELYLPFSKRSTHGVSEDNFNGTYDTVGNLIGLNLRLSF